MACVIYDASRKYARAHKYTPTHPNTHTQTHSRRFRSGCCCGEWQDMGAPRVLCTTTTFSHRRRQNNHTIDTAHCGHTDTEFMMFARGQRWISRGSWPKYYAGYTRCFYAFVALCRPHAICNPYKKNSFLYIPPIHHRTTTQNAASESDTCV